MSSGVYNELTTPPRQAPPRKKGKAPTKPSDSVSSSHKTENGGFHLEEMDGGTSSSLTPTPRRRGGKSPSGGGGGGGVVNGTSANGVASVKPKSGRELLPPPKKGAGTASTNGGAASDAAGAAAPSTNPALDHHIREIESSDGSLSTTVRAIYDDKNSKDSFVDRLDGRIRQHDRDIETMCNHYYQGFVDSIRELLGVRQVRVCVTAHLWPE